MAVIVESDGISIIPVNSGCSDNGSAKIASNVFCNDFRITEIWFCIDIETVFVLAVAFSFYFFKGRSDFAFHFIEESSTESIAEIVVVKVFDMTPETIITVATFGKDAVYVGIPFEVAAKSMKDHDIAWGKIFGMVQVEKHPCYYTGDGMEETVQERTVLKEENAQVFINGKNAMTVLNVDEFERHTGSAFHGILVSAGRTKTAVTAKGNKLEITAVRAGVHGAAK